jgi:hypothetical protein
LGFFQKLAFALAISRLLFNIFCAFLGSQIGVLVLQFYAFEKLISLWQFIAWLFQYFLSLSYF